ncbi:MAG: RNA-directed DNA polymerase, partial [Atopobiaceae bacterium]|nr:RNA-directed DNA polymerase [Atopobiaceae bacterium]
TKKMPPFVTAYEPGSSIAANARIHADNRHMLHLDIADFFHSCDADMVKEVFRSVRIGQGCDNRQAGNPLTDEDTKLLVSLSTLRNRLTVGSPSSPFLANRILLPFDYEVQAALGPRYAYSRYSDDIIISSNDRIDSGLVVSVMSERLGERGFRLNDEKTRCAGPGDKRKVTGVILTPDGSLSVGRSRKRKLERDLYRYLVHGEGSARSILGMLDFCRSVEPSYVTKLLIKYKSYGIAETTPGGVIAALRVADNCH